jgi:hypothetical protein
MMEMQAVCCRVGGCGVMEVQGQRGARLFRDGVANGWGEWHVREGATGVPCDLHSSGGVLSNHIKTPNVDVCRLLQQFGSASPCF